MCKKCLKSKNIKKIKKTLKCQKDKYNLTFLVFTLYKIDHKFTGSHVSQIQPDNHQIQTFPLENVHKCSKRFIKGSSKVHTIRATGIRSLRLLIQNKVQSYFQISILLILVHIRFIQGMHNTLTIGTFYGLDQGFMRGSCVEEGRKEEGRRRKTGP